MKRQAYADTQTLRSAVLVGDQWENGLGKEQPERRPNAYQAIYPPDEALPSMRRAPRARTSAREGIDGLRAPLSWRRRRLVSQLGNDVDDGKTDVWVGDAVGSGSKTGPVVAATMVKAGELTAEHIGKHIGFHDNATQLNISGKILRVEHNDGPLPSVSIWFRYVALMLGLASRDDFMRVAPWFEVQLVETLTF